MIKLILHLALAVVLWLILAWLGLSIIWRIAAIVAGAIVVHLVWEHAIFNPYLYLGAMAVSDEDPIMVEARRRASETLPVFLKEVFPAHPKDCMVKFGFKTSSGITEHVWADLLEVNGDRLKVYVRTPPISHQGSIDRTQYVNVADVSDWQAELGDGTIRGGFTTFALFKVFERQEGYMHRRLRSQVSRFKDVFEPVRK